MKTNIQFDDRICDNCIWYNPSASKNHGYCRRFPPVFTKHDEKGFARFFNPVVGPANFCGEWKDMESEE